MYPTLRTVHLGYREYPQSSGKTIQGWFFLQGGMMGLRSLRYGVDAPVPITVTAMPRAARESVPKTYTAQLVAVQAYKSQVVFEGETPDKMDIVQAYLDARHLKINPLRIQFVESPATDTPTPTSEPMRGVRTPFVSNTPPPTRETLEAALQKPEYAAFAPFLQFVQDDVPEAVLAVREGHYELTMPFETSKGGKQEATVLSIRIGLPESEKRLFEYLQHIAEWDSMRSCQPDFMPRALCFIGDSDTPTFSLQAKIARQKVQTVMEEDDFGGFQQAPSTQTVVQNIAIPPSGCIATAEQTLDQPEPAVQLRLLLTNHGWHPVYATLLLFDCKFGSIVLHNAGRCHLESGETEDMGMIMLQLTIPRHLAHLESVRYYAKIVVSDVPAHCPPGVFDAPLPAPGYMSPIPPPVTVRCIDQTGFDYSDWASFLFPIIVKNPHYK